MTTTRGTYRAAVVRTPGGPDSIEMVDVAVREPGPGEVRVDVAGAPVNPVDLGVVGGFFHGLGLVDQPEHTGLGWEFAGTVSAAGPGTGLAVGARVAGLVPGFDRSFGPYAEQLVVPAAEVAEVPDGLDLVAAATVPLSSLTASQVVDLLGEPAAGADRLLVTGAAGPVGAHVAVLAREAGWRVTGLARAQDEEFVRGLGAEFVVTPQPGWDAVADCAVLQEGGLALVGDRGTLVGMRPGMAPPAERGVRVETVSVDHDTQRLRALLLRAAAGELPVRVQGTLPLDRAAEVHRIVAKGGVRGRYVLRP